MFAFPIATVVAAHFVASRTCDRLLLARRILLAADRGTDGRTYGGANHRAIAVSGAMSDCGPRSATRRRADHGTIVAAVGRTTGQQYQ